jgi:glucose-6-phosphate dehydrogenase assembly protein OpcA
LRDGFSDAIQSDTSLAWQKAQASTRSIIVAAVKTGDLNKISQALKRLSAVDPGQGEALAGWLARSMKNEPNAYRL